MFGIIISGHGHYASGVYSSMELILGEQKDVAIVDFPQTDTKTELENNIHNAIKQFENEEHILICCDLLSGSPFNVSIMEAMKDNRIKVLYGVNIGMLLEIFVNRNLGKTFEEVCSTIVETGQSEIGFFDCSLVDDDDDF
ncbi:MAG: PTS sugar transporter subunit IIA [Erysipelotrichaceae bacterium]|nr:PTS sugar transporter subunit IIA [Erysipelotrichaceae bacterium]